MVSDEEGGSGGKQRDGCDDLPHGAHWGLSSESCEGSCRVISREF